MCAWAEGSLCHQLSWRQMRCMQHLSSRQRIEKLIRQNRAHQHSFSIAWGFQNAWGFSANDKPVPSMAYAAAPCVMDPLHGPKRAAAAAQLEDVVRALLAQSAASGRLRMTRQRVAGPWQMHGNGDRHTYGPDTFPLAESQFWASHLSQPVRVIIVPDATQRWKSSVTRCDVFVDSEQVGHGSIGG